MAHTSRFERVFDALGTDLLNDIDARDVLAHERSDTMFVTYGKPGHGYARKVRFEALGDDLFHVAVGTARESGHWSSFERAYRVPLADLSAVVSALISVAE